MKKAAILILALLLTLFLQACEKPATTYTVEKDGKAFQVDSEAGTLSDGTHTYTYTFSGDSESYVIDIYYPNGSSFHWTKNRMLGYGSQSGDYNDELYISGEILCEVIATKAPTPANPGKFWAVVILLGIGIFNAAAPQASWYLSYGWRFKDAEPSDLALNIGRTVGIFAIIAGVFMIFL